MKYEILLFDADHTLFDFEKSEYIALRGALLSLGLPASDAHIKRYSDINCEYWKKLERGEIDKERLLLERFEVFCREYGFAEYAEALSDLYIEKLSSQADLLDGALELVASASKKYRLFIITNGLKTTQDGRFAISPITKYFEKIFISEVIGWEKPSAEFFDFVANSIDGYNAEKTLVIGDSLTSDIKGAINSGLDCIWYNPKKKSVPDGWNITYNVSNYGEIYRILGI